MSLFGDIVAAYMSSDNAILAAPSVTEEVHVSHARRMEQVNDSAYFFMLFARFEDQVVTLSKQLVDQKRTTSSGAEKRPWDVINPDSLTFLNRVALLTDKGGSDYRDVQTLYLDRNRIGHGHLLETKPNVPVIAAKLSGILSRLEGIP